MAVTHEEARTKICIHSHRITPGGRCVGDECMAWSYIYDYSRLVPGETPVGVPTDKGYCKLLTTIKVVQST